MTPLSAPIVDWNDAYANAAHIPGGDDYPERWAQAAASFRRACDPAECATFDLAYGGGERRKLDLFRPRGTPRGLFVFVHGGYWLAFDKSAWSHLAAGALERGWAVAMPSYLLAPEARIGDMTRDVQRAIGRAADEIPGPIGLAGHSAGGHLVTRAICADTSLAPETLARVERVVSISGLHDLRPLMRTAMNERLRLDPAECAAESPALLAPAASIPVTCWVGGRERPEFLRQSALLANIWTGLGVPSRSIVEDGRHHFDVIEGLTRADSPLTEACAP